MERPPLDLEIVGHHQLVEVELHQLAAAFVQDDIVHDDLGAPEH